MTRLFKIQFVWMVIAGVACTAAHKADTGNLYKSSVFTQPKSFTSGAEGPAVDKTGTLYAVNVDHEGTVGRVTPGGHATVFIELPNKSIGNGIRFNSKGEMCIADYTNHNILKVDM